MLNAIKIGSEILVNTTTLSSQEAPAITGLTNGGFVATWTDFSATGGDTSIGTVRAQVFDADGGKVGSELLVPTTTTGTQNVPTITALADGRFVIGWEDASRGAGDNSGSAIRAQIFNADGTQSGGEFLIPVTTFGHQSKPTIAGLPDGRFVAAWMDTSGVGDLQPTGIRAQIFNADGTRSGGEFLVNTTIQNGQEEPSITALADGHFVVTWVDQSVTGGDLSFAAIRAQVFNGDGTKSGSEFLVNTTTTGGQFDPSITGLTDGRFVVAWMDTSMSADDASGYAVRAQIFNDDGTRSGGEFLVNTTTASIQQQPSITALPDGQFVAVWADGSGSTTTAYAVRAQLFGSDGAKVGAEFVVNTTDVFAQWRPAVTALDEGRFVVAWEDQSTTGGDTSSYAIRAQIFDLHQAPVIVSGDGDTATVTVNENTNTVTTVTATDADSPVLSYSIAGGADAAQFQIDPSTGVLSFVTAPNFEMPTDADSDEKYEVVVRASDGTLSDTQAITVTVANVNEAPVISPDRTMARAENTQAAMYVDTYDPENDGVAYSIVGGADASLFQIDGATGALSFVTAPDFEAPVDADQNNSYLVVARVSDGALSADQSIRVEINDVNEAPTITSGGSIAMSENGTAVTAVTASDPDTSTTLHYSLAGGADASFFQIDDATGALSFIAAPDFEAPADADQDNTYEVVVRASDGSLSDDQAMSVNVTDVVEHVSPGPRFGDEFLVNTTTFGHQYAPAIAGSVNGRFVAIWTDGSRTGGDTSFDSIRAQVFNADGTKSGDELLANATTTGSQDEPAIATLSDGRFVAAWTNYYQADTNGNASDIRGQIFDVDGAKAGAEFVISAAVSRQTHPVITALADGRFVAAWESSAGIVDGSAEGIRAQVFNADGTKSGDEFQVNTTIAGSQIDPAITVLANGNFVLAWSDYSGTGGDQSLAAVRAQVFHPDGAKAGNEFLVNTTTVDGQNMPTITGLPDGRFVAAWTDLSQSGEDTDHTGVRGQIFNADGTKSGAEFLVNTTTAFAQDHPVITGLRDGRFVAAWVDTVPTEDNGWSETIRAQVFNRDGTKFGAEFVIDTLDSLRFDPTITALADGRFALAWSDASLTTGDTSGLGIHSQIFDARDAAVHLKGTSGADDYIGTGFDDTMRGGGGNDRLDGGAGDDTAIFQYSHDQYSVEALAGGRLTVSGPDGVDTLSNFEHLRFADVTVDADRLHAPQIVSDGGGDTATLSVNADQTAVTTVSAVDADPGTTLSYAISGGADAGSFVIDSSTGVLSFATAPAGSGHDSAYAVQVRASDGIFADTQTITVNVTEVNEQPQPDPHPPHPPHPIRLTGTPGDDTFAARPGVERIDALGGNDTVSFDFKLTDAVVTYAGNKVIIDGPSSHTILTGFEKFVFTDGTVDNNDGDPLVDDLFYYSRNHDVWDAHADADAHFHVFGWHEGRDPSAFFSTSTYLSLYQDVATTGSDPLLHFDQFGWKEGRVPSFAFDDAGYLAANPDVAAAHVDPLKHFLLFGAQEGREPVALTGLIAANGFDYVYYLQHNPDVAAAHVDPLQHFNQYGWHEGRNPNALFDTNGYLAAYADVKAAGVNPLDHYHQFGWSEGRDSSATFDTAGYLGQNADVATAHIDPLLHYLHYGQNEGRVAIADGLWG